MGWLCGDVAIPSVVSDLPRGMVHDVGMRGRAFIWAATVVAVAGIAGLGAYLAIAGLDKASAASGVVVGCVELVALAVGVYGVVRERRDTASSQVVSTTSVAGSIAQVRRVKGNVRLSRPIVPPPPDVSSPMTKLDGSHSPGAQSVTGSQVSGHLDQVDDVSGDVELD